MLIGEYQGATFEVNMGPRPRARVVVPGVFSPDFTIMESRVFQVLLGFPGKVATPRMFAAHLYGLRQLPDQKILDVFVSKIRKKLHDASIPDPITSVWGRGYRFGEAAPAVSSQMIPSELRGITRWVISRKEAVLRLLAQEVPQGDVLCAYPDLSAAELAEWRSLFAIDGRRGLRTTRAWL